MSIVITGIVQEIKSRGVSGGKTSYDIVVAGQEYGAGLYAPKCKEGDYVKFDLDESRGYKNVGRNSLKVSANKPPAEAVAAAAASPAPTGGSDRQDTISRQSASNTALQLLAILSTNEALGLPASAKGGAKAKAIETILSKYTQMFYEQNTGTAWKDIAPKQEEENAPDAEAEEAPEAEAPADEEWS